MNFAFCFMPYADRAEDQGGTQPGFLRNIARAGGMKADPRKAIDRSD